MLIAVLGLGYVGLPVLESLHRARKDVLGYDISVKKIAQIKSNFSSKQATEIGLTSDQDELRAADVYIVCVPTPLNHEGLPDTSFVAQAAEMIRDSISGGGQTPLVILESSVAPGTTRKLFLELFEEAGMKLDQDYLLGYSPERIDPGNKKWNLNNTPKIVSGASETSLEATRDLYQLICDEVVEAESLEEAETAKLFENTFRQVNIALVNELSMALDNSGMSVHHVLDLAATKPFGFMKFTPGPGVGGHCIPIDPIYLNQSLEARHGKRLSVVDLAHEINSGTPVFHANKVQELLSETKWDRVEPISVLLAGVAYKENSEDVRETPAIEIVRRLRDFGFDVSYFDTSVESFTVDGLAVNKHANLNEQFDAVMLLHKFDDITIKKLSSSAQLVYDTKGQI